MSTPRLRSITIAIVALPVSFAVAGCHVRDERPIVHTAWPGDVVHAAPQPRVRAYRAEKPRQVAPRRDRSTRAPASTEPKPAAPVRLVATETKPARAEAVEVARVAPVAPDPRAVPRTPPVAGSTGPSTVPPKTQTRPPFAETAPTVRQAAAPAVEPPKAQPRADTRIVPPTPAVVQPAPNFAPPNAQPGTASPAPLPQSAPQPRQPAPPPVARAEPPKVVPPAGPATPAPAFQPPASPPAAKQAQPPVAKTEPPASPPASAPPAAPTPALDANLAQLVERAHQLMRIANIKGARDLLEPAKGRNPEVMSELARTYDPVELREFKLVPPGTANPARALELYTEAARLGSTSARGRFERLQQYLKAEKR